ncbi:serine protease inhibitor 42Dd-like [Lucilia sericata]|uniref:serine protease inhibitor 42Dd-like n=1 Tax=Lucilia sericata TaxID=13632 RepID=UPI0018A82157|nr:serine protease inhibitor 42Dd-like [Lucilia sericata]
MLIPLKNMALFLAAIICLNLVQGEKNPFPEPGSHNLLAADLFHSLVESKSSENIFFSPLAAETALTSIYAGAKGKTAEDLRTILRLEPVDTNRVAQDFGEFLKTLLPTKSNTKTGDPQLFLANGIYIPAGFKISPEFNRILKDNFESLVENVNFAENKLTIDKINKWIEQQTNDKVKHVLHENDIDPFTNVLLVNGLYFKGKWKYAFNKEETKTADFKLNLKEISKVDLMHIRGKFSYAQLKDIKAQALELPFNNTDMALIIILPDDIEGLAELEKHLKSLEFNYIPSRLAFKDVCAYIPKFRIEHEQDLRETLEKIGLSNIFSDKADFSGIFDSSANQFISAVKQKSVFEIDETGAESAAASGEEVDCRKAPLFLADHPFIFGIRSKSAVYFAGHLAKI